MRAHTFVSDQAEWDKCRTALNKPPLGFQGPGSIKAYMEKVCMRLCMYVKVAACKSDLGVCVCTCIYIHICLHVCMHMLHTYMHRFIHAHIHVQASKGNNALKGFSQDVITNQVYVCMCICIYTCV